jgi:hypothetical protein
MTVGAAISAVEAISAAEVTLEAVISGEVATLAAEAISVGATSEVVAISE